MPTKVVIGLQWGDEGKGKVVDQLVHDWANVVVRYQGGPNAGHTIYNEEGKKFVTHALPSGVLKNECKNIIAKGCVINPISLHKEIKEFRATSEMLRISDMSPLILPHHVMIDKLKYQTKIGTTAKGIGPAYADYISRDNKIMLELCNCLEDVKNHSYNQLRKIAEFDVYSKDYFKSVFEKYAIENGFEVNVESENYIKDFMYNQYFPVLEELSEFYSDYIEDTDLLLQQYYNENRNIILEGAQGWGLDVWGRSYPNVTSSSPNIGGVLTYTGLNHKQIDEVIGVVKLYKSKVGSGSFRTEWVECDRTDEIRKALGEYGATTGRPRRLGWLDLDEVKSACQTNGIDSIVFTRVDSVALLDEFKFKLGNNIYEIDKWSINDPDDMQEDELIQRDIIYFVNLVKTNLGLKNIHLSYGKRRNQLKWNM